MGFLIVIILGIVQGAAEFLPVSSSGHLVVFYNIFNITQNTIMLSIILHVATLLSVIVVYHKSVLQLIKNPFCKTNKLLLVATAPTVIIVLMFRHFIERSFSGNIIIVCFLVTAALLALAEYIASKKHKEKNKVVNLEESDVKNYDISYKQALLIGSFQGIATVPGISRSGATISAGLISGVNKSQAANFSFLLSIPIILASLLYEVVKLTRDNGVVFSFTTGQLIVGFLVSFVVGVLALKVMIRFVKRQKLWIFSIYLVLLVVFLLLNQYVVHIF